MRTPRSSWKSAPRWSRRRRSRSPAACSPSAALGPDARPGLTGQQVRDAWRTIAAATHPDRPDSGDPDAYAAPRLPADRADTAVLAALAAFYAQDTTLITTAITRAQAHHADGHAGRQAEAGALLAQIKAKETATGRYKIPAPCTPIPGHDTAGQAAVRTMPQQVGPVGFEPTLSST